MNKSGNKLFFICILIIAFVLRFYSLGKVPLSLDWDEVSNAYNAYSILHTGRDEYGNFLPLANRSFDDYKPPAHMYLDVPSVAVFGLTPFAARLPSALFGFFTVPIIYFLAKWIFKKTEEGNREKLGLITMFLLAVSPWHIQFSRVGFEANVGLFFSAAAITSALYGIKKHWLLPLSAITLSLSLYSYHSQKLFMPLFFLFLVIAYRNEIIKIPKKYIIGFVTISALMIMPMFTFGPKQALYNRFESTSMDSYIKEVNTSVDYMNFDRQFGYPFSNIIHNRRIIIAQSILDSYFKHFALNFLFVTGDDNPRHHVDNMGMLYFFELPIIIFAIYKILSSPSSEYYVLIAWLLIAPIPASLSQTAPHAIRSYLILIPLEILSALGLFSLINTIKKFRSIAIIFIGVLIGFSIIVYLENYYVHYALNKATSWQYPYQQAVLDSQNYANQGSRVYISSEIDQAYIFWLFYTKYNPSLYQKFGNSSHFANYNFNSSAPTDVGSIYISGSLSQDFDPLNAIKDPNGQTVVSIGIHK